MKWKASSNLAKGRKNLHYLRPECRVVGFIIIYLTKNYFNSSFRLISHIFLRLSNIKNFFNYLTKKLVDPFLQTLVTKINKTKGATSPKYKPHRNLPLTRNRRLSIINQFTYTCLVTHGKNLSNAKTIKKQQKIKKITTTNILNVINTATILCKDTRTKYPWYIHNNITSTFYKTENIKSPSPSNV